MSTSAQKTKWVTETEGVFKAAPATRRSRPRSVDEWAVTIAAAWQKSTEAIIETGRRLIDAKTGPNRLPHGEWLKMIESKLPFKEDVAQRLMVIARNPILTKTDHGRYLPASYQTLYALTKLPEPELRARLKDGSIHPKMERKDVAALRGEAPRARPRRPKQASDERASPMTIKTVIRASGPYDGCIQVVQLVLQYALKDLSQDDRFRLFAELHDELNHWEQCERNNND